MENDLPELKQLFRHLERIPADVRKADHDPVDLLRVLIDVPETQVRQVRIADDGQDRFHFHRHGGIQDRRVHHEDHIGGGFAFRRHTVMDLAGIDKDGVAGGQVDHLSVDAVGHLSRFYRNDLHVVMEVGHLFPGHVRPDPPVIDVGGKSRIVVIDVLRSVLPFDDKPQGLFSHNNLLPVLSCL